MKNLLTRIYFSMVTLLMFSSSVFAQGPDDIPVKDQDPIVFNFPNILIFIVVPALMLIYYIWWERKKSIERKKKEQEEKENLGRVKKQQPANE